MWTPAQEMACCQPGGIQEVISVQEAGVVQGRTGGVQDTICTLQCMPAQSAAPQPSLMLDTDNMQGVKICSAAQRSISTYLHRIYSNPN